MNKILEIRNLSKSYGRRGYQTWVLRDISLDILLMCDKEVIEV